MAGDWIKMRVDLADDPAVIGIAARLGLDEFAVVGRLHSLWSWADGQSRDGHAAGVTTAWVNRKLQCDGFAEAMIDVGWLSVDNSGITVPNFANHNGETAKTRALGKNRQQKARSNGGVTPSVTPTSRHERDESVTREEKRREEIEDTPQPPQAGAAGAVCKAIRGKGVTDVSPSHPELLALIAKGVSVETFEAAAVTCANSKPPKGLGYLLAIVKRQLAEAASITSGPSASVAADPDSKSAVEAEAAEKGIGPWSGVEQWSVYLARVRGTPVPKAISFDQLAGMAAQRAGAH